MSFSRILIHSDDVAQANRLALLLSRYGHDPVTVPRPDPLHLPDNLNGAMVDCRQLTAEWRVLCMALAQRGLPVVLFTEQLQAGWDQLVSKGRAAGTGGVRRCDMQ